MWARLRRFSALPRPAKALFLRAVIFLPLLTLCLRVRGFRATQRLLRELVAPRKNRPCAAQAGSSVTLTSRMVQAAVRNSPIPATCLEQSLCLWWLLARQGIVTQFRIGVRIEGEKLAAHAWVEYKGAAVGEPQGTHLHFAPFDEEMTAEDLSGDAP